MRATFLTLSALMLLAGCETTSEPPGPVNGVPPRPDELLLFNSRTFPLRTGCLDCPNKGGPMQVRLRLDGDNFAYQVAYAPLPGGGFDPEQNYRAEIDVWLNDVRGLSLNLGAIDFRGGSVKSGPGGRTWHVTDWFWNAVHYQNFVVRDDDYLWEIMPSIRDDNLKTLKLFHGRIANGVHAEYWRMGFSTTTSEYAERWLSRSLRGEAALAALDDPAAAYALIEPVDIAEREHKAKKAEAADANRAYRNFVARELTPLTLRSQWEKAGCPGIPGRLEVNYHPPETFYAAAQRAIGNAECLSGVLDRHDPTVLLERYEAVFDQESELYAATYDVERFELPDGSEIDEMVGGIEFSLQRAEEHYRDGDITVQKRARQRADQAARSATMQSLMAGLQGVEASLRQQQDVAAAQVNRLTRRHFLDQARRKRAELATARAGKAASSTGTGLGSAAIATTAPASSARPAEPMLTVYLASNAITSLPSDIPHCDQGQLDSARSAEVKCTARRLVTLPHIEGGNPASCSGDPERDVIDANEAAIIGGIYRMQAVTRTELARLRNHAEARTGATAGIFFEQDEARAASSLEQWKRHRSNGGKAGLFFLDRTELANYLREQECTAIRWRTADGRTRMEPLDRTR